MTGEARKEVRGERNLEKRGFKNCQVARLRVGLLGKVL